MFLLLLFAFLSGIITILAPCIWPILPIVLSTSSLGGKRRPLGVVVGVILSFSVFTLSASYLVSLLHLDFNFLRTVSVIVIGFLGLSLLIPKLSAMLEVWVGKLISKLPQSNTTREGFGGGFGTGFVLGLVWSPCAGPILATIAALSATQSVSGGLVLVTLAYALGIGVPLFLLATFGSRLFLRLRLVSTYTGLVQKVFGVVIIITAIAIYFGWDQSLQIYLLDKIPAYSNVLYSLENSKEVKDELERLGGRKVESLDDKGKQRVVDLMNQAPEFVGITNWLNLDSSGTSSGSSLRLSDLRGKVVLVDFWTYTCINCVRTVPHVTSWYNKYHDQGFVVVGVHTPEFSFEKDTNNVKNAITKFGIKYPVAQDNAYATWNNYQNHYWPAEYLIDAKGIIRHTHFGEGEYDKTEQAIQDLLKESGQQVADKIDNLPDETPTIRMTPETYLGSDKSEDPSILKGDWSIQPDFAQAGKASSIDLNFFADKVFLVINPAKVGDKVQVLIDPLLGNENSNLSEEVEDGVMTLDSNRLYKLVDFKGHPGQHLLHLDFPPGTKVFAFTFG